MCTVSLIMDHFHDKWAPLVPSRTVPDTPFWPPATPPVVPTVTTPLISPAEVEEFRRLLERAREYDRKMGQPDCELDEKRRALKDVARQLGVEIAFV